MLSKLAMENIDSVFLREVLPFNFLTLEQSIVDKVQVYIAPKIIGGDKSKTPVAVVELSLIKSITQLHRVSYRTIGDILIKVI